MEWIKGNLKVRDKTPEENLCIAKIQTMMLDSFGLIDGLSGTPSNKQRQLMIDNAKSWFESKDCEWFCDMAGTEYDHVLKLFQNLQYNYNTGKITKQQLKFGIRHLDLKL